MDIDGISLPVPPYIIRRAQDFGHDQDLGRHAMLLGFLQHMIIFDSMQLRVRREEAHDTASRATLPDI